MKNLKDLMTTIAGVLGAIGTIGGTVIAVLVQQHFTVPPIVTAIAGVCVAVSAGILGYFGGKNSDGTTKTPEQLTSSSDTVAK